MHINWNLEVFLKKKNIYKLKHWKLHERYLFRILILTTVFCRRLEENVNFENVKNESSLPNKDRSNTYIYLSLLHYVYKVLKNPSF